VKNVIIEEHEGVSLENISEEYRYIKDICIEGVEIKKKAVMEERFKLTKEVKVKGPLTSKIAEELVLRILAEARKPLTRKEIVKKASEMIDFTEKDLQRTKSGRPRWETYIRWVITRLGKRELAIRTERNQWIITEKGREFLKLFSS